MEGRREDCNSFDDLFSPYLKRSPRQKEIEGVKPGTEFGAKTSRERKKNSFSTL